MTDQSNLDILKREIQLELKDSLSVGPGKEDANFIANLVQNVLSKVEELQRGFLLGIRSFDKEGKFPIVFSLSNSSKQLSGNTEAKLKFLCEKPGEWHLVGEQTFDIKDLDLFVASVTSVLFPLNQILLQSSISTLEIVMRNHIQGSLRTETQDVAIAKLFGFFKTMMKTESFDEVQKCVQHLTRVRLPTGEIQWLCEHHCNALRKF